MEELVYVYINVPDHIVPAAQSVLLNTDLQDQLPFCTAPGLYPRSHMLSRSAAILSYILSPANTYDKLLPVSYFPKSCNNYGTFHPPSQA